VNIEAAGQFKVGVPTLVEGFEEIEGGLRQGDLRACGAVDLPVRRAAAVTWDFVDHRDLVQR